jgi:hypothetical protein
MSVKHIRAQVGVTFTLFILMQLWLSAGESLALDIIVERLTREDIQSAVDQVKVADGGTIYLAEARATLDGRIRITNTSNVKIIGRGVDKTVFENCVESYMFYITDSSDIRISGISLYGSEMDGIYFSRSANCRVDHSYFSDFRSHQITFKGGENNVVDHCEFRVPQLLISPDKAPYGVAVVGTNEGWPDIKDILGTKKAIVFVEDCIFSGQHHAVSSTGDGAHYVVRHSTFEGTRAKPIDAHGYGSGGIGDYGTRAIEVYDNAIVYPIEKVSDPSEPNSYPWDAITPRGGGGVIFNNEIRNYRRGINMTVEELSQGSAYPASHMVGSVLVIDQVHEMWIWANNFDIQESEIGFADDSAVELIQEGRDYFLRAPSASNGELDYTPYSYPHPIVAGSTEPDPDPEPETDPGPNQSNGSTDAASGCFIEGLAK